mmetsp:Transcript_12517/g.43806  ORF Transcript_12517/g.43806 Transcript_12517/m.43806 type:complete len:235 (-) Transcript_12517:63-767(-)|eukprot:CAMPEP_0203816050 /NCGR_PEP_ID=MMETSP0115-20131106/14315_1 /ASSEMBLY_ACC=CAM_ASM_000227 /TAXON_ID=33651 /ORGANISM="Bicosoecid sp, Strain ms1" /LENGTH=234 /DNA_ID=CAMNT_0050724949 /DNA_START=175 /DNA_END=879 /DNA_ORIENTATION=-
MAAAGAGGAADVGAGADPAFVERVSVLYRVHKTTCSMLRKRGYEVESRYDMTLEQFTEKYADEGRTSINPEDIYIYAAKPGAVESGQRDQMLVFFPSGKNVGVKHVTDYHERMQKGENEVGPVRRAILVVEDKLTSKARTAIADIQPKWKIEHFKLSELLVDITEHVLVPKHQVLNEDEKAALLERYKLQEHQLPRIQITDPVARFYGMARGQVVKIVRSSETAGRYVTYRLVI